MTELWGVLTRHFPEFRTGFLVTLQLVSISFVIAVGSGSSSPACAWPPTAGSGPLGRSTSSFRNVPLLVLIIMSYAGLRRSGVEIGPFVAGTASLGLYTAAYVAESVRSGVFAVGQGRSTRPSRSGSPTRRPSGGSCCLRQ